MYGMSTQQTRAARRLGANPRIGVTIHAGSVAVWRTGSLGMKRRIFNKPYNAPGRR